MDDTGSAEVRAYTCGIRTLVYRGLDEAVFTRHLVQAAGADDFSLMLVFFDPAFDAEALGCRLKTTLDVPTQICCSTAGEIGPFGYLDGGAVAMLFPSASFEALAAVVPSISLDGLDKGRLTADDLRRRFERMTEGEAEGQPLAICLVDGLSNHEEVVVSAFDAALSGIPLVGGSAGDGLDFAAVKIVLDGRLHEDAAVLCLIHSRVPFRIFKSDHYTPTDTRLVVTDCDVSERVVTGLNGAPAAVEYANVLGLDPGGLDRFSFASYPVVVKIGGEHYCRSIRRMENDGLSFFCAVDTGVVLTLAEPRDMVASMRQTLEEIEADLGRIDIVLGFDCVLRKVEAQERQLGRGVARVFRDYNVLGFTTYGEQYRAMHLNQTFTGVAFGHRDTMRKLAAE